MSSETFGPYSPVRVSGEWLFISGQIGVDPETGLVAPGIEAQTRQVLANLAGQLETVDADPSQVVKTTIFLQNIDDFAAVNEIYSQFFTRPYPARSCLGVANLPRVGGTTELLVEIEAVAHQPEGGGGHDD